MQDKEKYIKYDDIVNAFNKFIEARKKKSNCSKGALIELKVFQVALEIVKKMTIYEF